MIASAFAGFAVLGLALGWTADPHPYLITDLGTLGGDSSEALDVNTGGQVVGWSATAGGQNHAFLYRAGAMTDLGTLPGGTSSVATAINDLSQVVGYGGINAYGPMFQEYMQGFIWRDGSMQSLGALYCPCSFNVRYGTSAAYHINIGGAAVGDSETYRGKTVRHAFLWRDGVMQDIAGAGSTSISYAYGINAAGQVVGSYDDRACLWDNGTRRDLGTLPGHASSTARAVNSLGQAAGESVAGTGLESRAVLWDGASTRDLGALTGDPSSRANDINSLGQVVGRSGSMDGVVSRAVLWQAGAIIDLNSLIPPGSGWELKVAYGINDAGQIAGSGLHGGLRRAFLMSPPGLNPVSGGGFHLHRGR